MSLEARLRASLAPLQAHELRVALTLGCLGLALVWPVFTGKFPTSSSCWVVTSYSGLWKNDHWTMGMPGGPPDREWEDDENFVGLYFLYYLALLTSAAGVLLEAKQRRDAGPNAKEYNEQYWRYLGSLAWYFFAQLVINLVAMVSFIENRCRYHNEWSAERDGAHQGAYIYRGSAAAAWAKVLLMSSTMGGGVATNVLLELVLLRRAQMMRGFDGAAAHCRARFLTRLITFEIFFVCVVFLPLGLLVNVKMVYGGPAAIFDTNGDGDIQEDEDPTWAVSLLMSAFGLVHIGVTIGLCVLFAGLLGRQASTHHRWGGDPHTLMFRTVFASTCVALLSTLLCYVNFEATFLNWYVALALDSIVNDGCLMVVAFPGALSSALRCLRGEAAGDEFGLPSALPARVQPSLLSAEMRAACAGDEGSTAGRDRAATADSEGDLGELATVPLASPMVVRMNSESLSPTY